MNQTILIVDDQLDSLKAIKHIFDQADISYKADSDSDSICQYLATESLTKSIILRFESHQIDGRGLCGRIRSLPGCQNLHIVMIVSEAAGDQTIQALAAGANDIITEPIRRAELLNRCGVIQRRQMRRIEVGTEDVLADSHVAIESSAVEPSIVDSSVNEDSQPVQSENISSRASLAGYQIHPAENRGFIQESGFSEVEDVETSAEDDSVDGNFTVVDENVVALGTRIDSGQPRVDHQSQPEPTVIQPIFDAATQRYVYPTEAANIEVWDRDPDVIKVALDTVLTCPDCDAVPGFRFGCSDCGSGCTEQEMLIHHFACACVANESEFRDGRDFVCPKCRVNGLVAGTDFETTAAGFTCSDCFAKVDQPELIGHCTQCSLRFPAHQATVRKLIAYRLPVSQPDEHASQHHRPRFTSVLKKSGRTIHRSDT